MLHQMGSLILLCLFLKFILLQVTTVYLLTYPMVQSPSWEVNWFAASQEIPRISQNPKVHYRIHKRTPQVATVYYRYVRVNRLRY